MSVFSELDLKDKEDAIDNSYCTLDGDPVALAEHHIEARQAREAEKAQKLLKELHNSPDTKAEQKGPDTEEKKRKAHEEAEAKRKAEWEAQQKAKKEAEQAEWEKAAAMEEEQLVQTAIKRVGEETEQLTRRSLKECVAEYIQTECLSDPAFARQIMHPRKNMIRCFQYINRKAMEFIKQDIVNQYGQPKSGIYGGDVPDDLCYQWAKEYFWDMDAKEDKQEEEKFVPKPYTSKTAPKQKPAKKAEKKQAAQKKAAEITEQINLFEVA